MSEQILNASTFWELLTRRVELSPDQLFLSDDTGRQLTFSEFRDKTLIVAAGLHELGITTGTAVTWQLPTRIETVVLSFALSRLGAVQNPIIHIYRHREVGFCIAQTQARFVFTPKIWGDFDYQAMATEVTAKLDPRPQIFDGYQSLPEGDPSKLPPAPTDGDAVRWINYTSGTTSDPKGVMHSDKSLIAAGTGLALALETNSQDLGTIAFPYAHIGGPDYIVMLLVNGFGAILIEQFNPQAMVATYIEQGATMIGGSTAFYQMFLSQDQQLGGGSMPKVRAMAGGGAPKPPEIYFEVKEKMGIPIAHGYGMTECPMISQGSPSDTDEQLAHTEGAPVRGCAVDIVSADGTVAEPGCEGEVRVKGPMLFAGYTDPSLNDEAIDEQGRFRTGDLGIKHQDGHITLTGRVKDIIIRKGENISAKEIEDVLYGLPQVENAAVIGLPDPQRGERVCAVIETAVGYADLSFEQMTTACAAAGLMRQKTPEQLEVHDGPLPRNATMKILKYELRETYKDKPWP